MKRTLSNTLPSGRSLKKKREIADYLGVTTRCVDNWSRLRSFPKLKIGSVVRFDLEEVNQWLESNRESTTNN